MSILKGFKDEIRQARRQQELEAKAKPVEESVQGYAGEILEEEEYSDDKCVLLVSWRGDRR